MRLGALSIVILMLAQTATAANLPPAGIPDVGQLRSELGRARLARMQAEAKRSRAYREAHILYKNCAKELRVFCLLSAQTIMRDADFHYKDREGREFHNIPLLERIIAALEEKTKTGDPVR